MMTDGTTVKQVEHMMMFLCDLIISVYGEGNMRFSFKQNPIFAG